MSRDERGKGLSQDETEIFKAIFQGAMLRERQGVLDSREGGDETVRLRQLAQSIDKAESATLPAREDGSPAVSTRMMDKIFDKETGSLKENASAIMAYETGRGPEGLNFAGLGGKVDTTNSLLKNIETTLEKIAGTFDLRKELKDQATIFSSAQATLAEAANNIKEKVEARELVGRERLSEILKIDDKSERREALDERGLLTQTPLSIENPADGTEVTDEKEANKILNQSLTAAMIDQIEPLSPIDEEGERELLERAGALEPLIAAMRNESVRASMIETQSIPTLRQAYSSEDLNDISQLFQTFKESLQGTAVGDGLQSFTLQDFYDNFFVPNAVLENDPEMFSPAMQAVGTTVQPIDQESQQSYLTALNEIFSKQGANLQVLAEKFKVDISETNIPSFENEAGEREFGFENPSDLNLRNPRAIEDVSKGDSIIFGIRPEEIKIKAESNTNSISLNIKDIEFKGSTSNINVENKNGDNFLKIQNISSSISQSFQQGNLINIELNTAVGTIFKNERNT